MKYYRQFGHGGVVNVYRQRYTALFAECKWKNEKVDLDVLKKRSNWKM